MTFIDSVIQNGFMRRRGWRGRWVTAYVHLYGGRTEETERFHSHPWKWAVSIVVAGPGFREQWEEKRGDEEIVRERWRSPFSIRVYASDDRHRIVHAEEGTRSLFIGLFRQQHESRCATISVPEGYCHYTEV